MNDKLHRIGDTTKFNITTEVLKECTMTYYRYAAALAKKREEEQKNAERKKKDNKRLEIVKSRALQLSDSDRKIRFIISHIYSLILFINLRHILDHIYGSLETIKI